MSVWTRPVLPAFTPGRLSPLMSTTLVALAAIAIAAAGFAAYAFLAADGGGTNSATSDWKAPLPAAVELGEPKPASADVQTLTRPIFDKDRRPKKKSSAPVPETKKVEETPLGYSVSAIVKHKGAAQAYIVTNGAGDWRKVGDKVDAWTVSNIANDEVTLGNDDTSVRLQLYNADPRPADVPPPPAPPTDQRQPPPPGAVREPSAAGNALPADTTGAPSTQPLPPPAPPVPEAMPVEAEPPSTVPRQTPDAPRPTPDGNTQQRLKGLRQE